MKDVFSESEDEASINLTSDACAFFFLFPFLQTLSLTQIFISAFF